MENVIIISSDAETAASISKGLSGQSSVKSATSVSAALQLHNSTPSDIIFIDLEPQDIAGEFNPMDKAVNLFKKNNPLVQFVMITRKESLPTRFKTLKEYASGLMSHPVSQEETRQVFESVREAKIKEFELDYLRDHFWKTDWLEIIYSHNPVMQKVYENIRAVAPTVATVLLLGETGTGKGLLARLIHWHSHRHEQPFIAVHCGAIPDTLLESELFGHEKGAFTGAERRKYGKFEMARGGTIFLDEIGTITPSAQIKLLQVLQDGTFSRVGGTDPMKTDARIIAATNADLKHLTETEQFRKDLYFRLNVFPIEIPPLKNRREDVSHLIDMFLEKLNAKYGKGIKALHPAVREGFKTYHWPGNIRELENILERAYLLENSDTLSPQNFPHDLLTFAPHMKTLSNPAELPLAQARQLALDAFESAYLESLLNRCKGKINLSAKEAGITPRQLSRLLSRYGIRKKDFKR